MDVQGSYKRVQLIRVSNSDSVAMSLNCCSPKTSLLVTFSSDTAYLIHWDKLLPHQIPPSPSPSPQTLKEKIYIYPTKKNCPLHNYWGDGSYLHPTWQRQKSGMWARVKIQDKVFFKVRSTLLQLICQRTRGNWLQEIQELVEKKKRLFISRFC